MANGTKWKPDLTDGGIVRMVKDVLARDTASRESQSTYLRTLVAGVQVELSGKPVLGPVRGRVKSVTVEDALGALAIVNGRFYGFVLEAVNAENPDASARERNARSGFARSAAATLRAAMRAGLNPLTVTLPSATKEGLRNWTAQHRPDKEKPSVTEGIRKARALVKRLADILQPMTGAEKATILEQVHADVAAMAQVVADEPGGIPARRIPLTLIEGGGRAASAH
jgi:hypothetical protein